MTTWVGTITGYTASNQLSVTLRDLDRAGEVLDAAAALVGNEIRFNGISFFVDDTTAVESDARTDAIEDARRSADDYAAAAGVEVRRRGDDLGVLGVVADALPGLRP